MGDVTRFQGRETAETKLSALESKLPVLLVNDWVPADPLPAEYRDALPVAAEQVKLTLEPVTNAVFFEEIAGFVDWADLFGLAKLPDDPRDRGRKAGTIGRIYFETLSDLPADLLALALRRTMKHHDYSVMPLPGDVRKQVRSELARRKLIALRLETARMFARFEEASRPVNPETAKAAGLELAACVKHMHGPKDDFAKGESDDPKEFKQCRVGPVGAEQVRKPTVGFTAAEMDESRRVLAGLTGKPRIPMPSHAAAKRDGLEGGS